MPEDLELALVFEDICKEFLTATEVGRTISVLLSQDESLDAMYGLLNAGYIKLVADLESDPMEFEFKVCNPPEKPPREFIRPTKN